MSNVFDTIPDQLTQQALFRNFSQDEKARREEVLKYKDFYYGKQAQYVKVLNDDQSPLTLNLTKVIVGKRAGLLYRKPLNREFVGPTQSISFLEDTYTKNDMHQQFLNADLLAELTGSAVFAVFVDPSGEIKLRLYDSSAISPVADEDDPSQVSAISVVREIDRLRETPGTTALKVEKILRSQVWTNNAVVVYDNRELMVSETNTLGFIPFVNFKGEEVPDQYLGHAPARAIALMNGNINQILTDLAFMVKMQSATPIILEGFQGGEAITIHPGRALTLPNGASASALQLNPQIEETLGLIQYLEDKIYQTSAVPKVSVIGGEGQSGRELIVRWFPLMQVFEEKSVRFNKYELQLANTVLRVVGLPPIEEVKIDWNEDEILPLSAESDRLESDISLNIITPADEILRRDPSLSEEEADIIALANKDFNDNLAVTNQ